jgi:hypothetical protein
MLVCSCLASARAAAPFGGTPAPASLSGSPAPGASMTTTSAEEKEPTAAAKSVDPAVLDPDEADRFAALIKPAWEDEDGAVQASSTATPAIATRPSDEGRATAIDPIPNVDVGDTLPTDGPPLIDTDALVASVEPSPPRSKGPPPAPSARPGATRMGIGNDVELAATVAAAAESEKATLAAGATRMGMGNASELAAAGAAELAATQVAEPDEDLIATQARPVASFPPSASAPPQPPRPAAGSVAPRVSAASANPYPGRHSDDDPISLPMNRGARGGGSMGVGIGIGLGIAALAGLAIFLVKGSGDDKPAPAPAATTAAAAAKPTEPEIKPPPIPAEEPAKEPAKADPPKEEPKADPPKEEPKADPPKAEAPKEEPKPPSGGSKPPSGGGKPTAPPSGGGKPKGGIIRDAPF